MQGFNYSDVLILLDYDDRSINYKRFLNELSLQLRRVVGDVHIAAPNVVIENWYLADIEYLSKRTKGFLKRNLKQKNYEGKDGRAELKKLIQKNVHYNEVIDGARLFKLIRFPVASQHSPSFRAFYEILNKYRRSSRGHRLHRSK